MNVFRRPSVHYGATPEPETPYQRAAQVWDERIGSARVQAKNWRLMAFGSLFLSAGLAGGLVWQSARGSIVPWVVQIDKLGEAQAVAPAVADYRADRSADRLASRALHRAGPRDPGRCRSSCARTGCAPTSSRPTAARSALNDYARVNDPFAKVGKQQIAVEVSSVIRASPDSLPRRLGRAPLTRTASSPAPNAGPPSSPSSCSSRATPTACKQNPLGIYVNAINWSKELWPMKPPIHKPKTGCSQTASSDRHRGDSAGCAQKHFRPTSPMMTPCRPFRPPNRRRRCRWSSCRSRCRCPVS